MNLNRKRRFEEVEDNVLPQKKSKTSLYLDDYTPIRTIEVKTIADNVSEEYLRGYFEHAAGPVSDVSIISKSEDNQNICVAHVTFVMPEDAARLICEPKMKFDIKFSIKEAESVYQPKLDPNTLQFEDIVDDCLLHIASYLNLADLVSLGKTSSRLQSIAVRIYQKLTHFTFDPSTGDSGINDTNVGTVLLEIGSFIQSLQWISLQADHLPYLLHCPNVTHLDLLFPSKDINSASIRKVKRFFRNLTKLEIWGSTIFDSTLKTITCSSKLTSLDLFLCPNVQGKFLTNWKNCQLQVLEINHCLKVDCEIFFNFALTNTLTKLSFDSTCSFKQCLTLPQECLSNFTEIRVDFSYFLDKHLELFNFQDLQQLTSLTMEYKYVDFAENCNNLLNAMSQIPKLETLDIRRLRIDADTIDILASFPHLRKIRLEGVNNLMGRQLYSSLHEKMPKITELSMVMESTPESQEECAQSIRNMVFSLDELKFFSHSSMTWPLMHLILQDRLIQMQRPIKIGISNSLFEHPNKKDFVTASKGAVILSLNK